MKDELIREYIKDQDIQGLSNSDHFEIKLAFREVTKMHHFKLC